MSKKYGCRWPRPGLVRRDIMKGNAPRTRGPLRRAARYLRSALRGR